MSAQELLYFLKAIEEMVQLAAWVIFPVAFFNVFMMLWTEYAGWYAADSWFGKLQWAVLEIIPPRDIERSPKLMESFFTGLTGVLTAYSTFDKYLNGAFTDKFSVEIVGEEGTMHFYIRTLKKNLNMVEAQIYAQYPNAEVVQVPDYTERFPKIMPNKYWDVWGADFEFLAANAIPIKTYDRFEETISGTLIDPMSAIAEVIGTLSPGQHIWLQYVLEPIPEPWAKEKEQLDVVAKLKKEPVAVAKTATDDFKDIFFGVFKTLVGQKVEFAAAAAKDQQPLEFRLSPKEKEVLKAVEDNLGKNVFKTKMRMLYLGRRDGFSRSYIGTFIGALKQFNDIHYNQFKPENVSKTYGNYIGKQKREIYRKRKIYSRYKKRNTDGTTLVFSTTELATMFHFPDISVKSPSVLRVSSKLGVAPPNLPVK